ncbi:SDR family oxidoreductase [Alkalihalobacillus sp. LMS39]|uniref:SDR family NAD(P)-dependent oxidoreductase n=1 Tax=Alkalihalobacillus sp. LMS39 TaxID=2924032 RepID=UPI001FB472E2|nr:SDR family oxidoreductase [Alkalihalobacillus sp. LMS39]UOE92682.1 SDR family oxidoreductase [Alkalihalobacillus sp. LMS39]
MKLDNGKWALVTGASSGIGKVFAHELAAKGIHLVLTARSETKLNELARYLEEKYQVQTEVIVADLSQAGVSTKLFQECVKRGRKIDILVNNAGFATHGLFEKQSFEKNHNQIMLNVMSLVELTHLFLPEMLQNRNGAVINVASTAAFQPNPYMAVYGATKAFVLSFTQALWEENRKRGVQFLTLCPGSTETAFFDTVGTNDAVVGKKANPRHVVDVALQSLGTRRSYVVAGRLNYLVSQINRIVPKKVMLQLVSSLISPKSK